MIWPIKTASNKIKSNMIYLNFSVSHICNPLCLIIKFTHVPYPIKSQHLLRITWFVMLYLLFISSVLFFILEVYIEVYHILLLFYLLQNQLCRYEFHQWVIVFSILQKIEKIQASCIYFRTKISYLALVSYTNSSLWYFWSAITIITKCQEKIKFLTFMIRQEYFLFLVLDIDWFIDKSFTPYRQYFSHVTAVLDFVWLN